MDKIEKYDDSIRKKNFHVIEAEDMISTIPELETFKKQFMFGAKNICGEYFSKRAFELDKAEYNIWLDKTFRTFDTIDTTGELKSLISQKVMNLIEKNKPRSGNEVIDEKEMTMSIIDNLTDRKANLNRIYKVFFLRYLSPRTREIVWKGQLLDPTEVKNYEKNIQYDKTFTVSKDEIYILKVIQSLMKDDFHNFGNDYDIIILIKAIMIYTAAYLNTYLQDFHYYMLFPLLQTFKSYRTYTRAKILISFYLSILRVRMEVVEEVNEKDETAYEFYINGIIEKLLEVCEEIDPKLKEKITELLAIEDSAIKTFHMDLMANVRGENHLSNLDLRISKQKVIFGELLRSFIERMSVGFVNIRVSCVIWDYILLKTNKNKDDLFIAFAVLLNIIKQDVYSSANVLELEKAFRDKSLMIDDYDYFCELFEYGKEKDWKQSFTLLDGDALRQNFISLDKIKESDEAMKKQTEEELARSQEIDQKQRQDMFNKFNTFQNPTYDKHNSMLGSQKSIKPETAKPDEFNYSMISGARRSQTKF